MSTPERSPRRYTDEEMRRLLERATELQHAEADRGLTLAELEDVAREAGIDVTALRRAADEIEGLPAPRKRTRTASIAGAPLSIRLERTLAVEASVETLEALVPLLQNASDGAGSSSLGGRTLAWHATSGQNTIELDVLVVARDGETRIRIEERYGSMAALIYGVGMGGIGSGVGFGVGVGVGVAIGSVAMAVAFPIVCLGGTYFGSRALYGALVRQRTTVLESLIETLAGAIEEGASPAVELPADASPPVLAPPDDEDRQRPSDPGGEDAVGYPEAPRPRTRPDS